MHFTFKKLIFLLFLQHAAASIVNESYSSNEDLYDAVLNTLFPITFTVLLQVKENPESIRNTVLPLFDDILYNFITWGIPLVVSFIYEDTYAIKFYTSINMFVHITCAIICIMYAGIKHKRLEDIKIDRGNLFFFIPLFLILFPVMAIPLFWVINISRNDDFTSINLIFLILFGLLLIIAFLAICCAFVYVFVFAARTNIGVKLATFIFVLLYGIVFVCDIACAIPSCKINFIHKINIIFYYQ